MDPYVAFGLAMCLIVGLSLAGTAYLAAHFNRRGKADLAARLEPLAAAIAGETDLGEARVRGRHRGQLAFGRVASAQGGIGRLFHVELVDAAGGAGWEWSSLPSKQRDEPTRAFEGDAALAERLAAAGVRWEELATVVSDGARQRFGFLYDPEAGMVRLSRAMRSRLDIPDAETFVRQLDALAALGEANRRAQGEAATASPAPHAETESWGEASGSADTENEGSGRAPDHAPRRS